MQAELAVYLLLAPASTAAGRPRQEAWAVGDNVNRADDERRLATSPETDDLDASRFTALPEVKVRRLVVHLRSPRGRAPSCTSLSRPLV